MRTLWTALVLTVMTLTLAPIVALASIVGIKERPGSIYERCMRAWAGALCRAAGVTIRLHGTEHMPQGRGAVYIANHVSWFDVFALAAVLPRYTFVAKAELRKIPIFGRGAEAAGLVFVERENRKSAFESYKSAATQIARGRSIVVCPEGTRGNDYALRPFKKGPFVLAIASGAPIVPTVVYGALEVMPKGSWLVHAHAVDIHFFPPIETTGTDYEDRGALMQQVWHTMADEMRCIYGVQTRAQPIERRREERTA